jgi:hypothetical protein
MVRSIRRRVIVCFRDLELLMVLWALCGSSYDAWNFVRDISHLSIYIFGNVLILRFTIGGVVMAGLCLLDSTRNVSARFLHHEACDETNLL